VSLATVAPVKSPTVILALKSHLLFKIKNEDISQKIKSQKKTLFFLVNSHIFLVKLFIFIFVIKSVYHKIL
jgi:hypothetical protein